MNVVWNRDRVIELAVKIDGWMDRDELGWLYDRAQEVPKDGVWVEVGCWKGRSFFATAMGLPHPSMFHAIDTWNGDPSAESHWEPRAIPGWLLRHFQLTSSAVQIIRAPNVPGVWVHRGTSQTVAPTLPQVDAIFIDGLHDYDSVRGDIETLYPLLKPGGLFAGHDYHLTSIQRAVQKDFPNVQIGAKNIWYVYKDRC